MSTLNIMQPVPLHPSYPVNQPIAPARSRATLRAVAVEARARFGLQIEGLHGVSHWSRVLAHGTQIAAKLEIDPHPIRLFALLHDCCRADEGDDPLHGPRAADFTWRLHRAGMLGLTRLTATMLADACRWHSEGHLDGPPMVQACWDADRLDLGRVGIRPDPGRLCLDVAREPGLIDWAWRWSRGQAAWRHRGQR